MKKELLLEKFLEASLIEKRMRDAYTQCLEYATDEEMKKIFQRLIQAETGHYQIDQEIIELIEYAKESET